MLRTLFVRTVVTGALIGVVTSTTSAAPRTWSGGGSDANWATPLNWVGGVAPIADDSLTFDGFARLSNNNNLAVDTNIIGLTFSTSAGAFTLGGNRVTLGGDIVDNTAILRQTVNLDLVLGANRTANVSDASGSLLLGGVISGTGGIIKNGPGLLTLGGTNTYTGPISVNAGTLAISNAANLGGASAATPLTLNSGTLRAFSPSTTGVAIVIPATRGIVLGSTGGPGAGTFEIGNASIAAVPHVANSVTYGGVISNNSGGPGTLNKTKGGSLTLFGANTYTGNTNIKNGTLTLDFASAAVNSNIITPASNLRLGGETAGLGQVSNATLSVVGKASTANTQTFAGTHIDVYGSVINATNGAGGTATVNLGALTRSIGGVVVIPTVGANIGTVKTTTTVAGTNGILGAWATAGTPTLAANRGITWTDNWATVDGSGNIVAYNGYVNAQGFDGNFATTLKGDPAIVGNADKNLRFANSTTGTELRVDLDSANSTTDINTFAYNNGTTAALSHTLTIGAGNTLRLGVTGGFIKQSTGNNQLYIGGAGGLLSGNGSGPNIGMLTAGGPNPNTPGEILLHLSDAANNNGGMNILASIVDNGSGAVTLVKNGVMSIKIDGHNTYSGGTFINQGRFQLAGSEAGAPNPDGLGTGPVTIAPGGYLFVSGVNGAAIFTGNGAISGALGNTAQNAPIPNNMTLSGNGTAQEGIGAIRLGGKAILSGQITLAGDARIGGSSANTNHPITYDTYPAINTDQTTLYVDPSHEFTGRITGPFGLDIGSNVSITTNFKISNTLNDWTGDTTFVTGGGQTTLRLGNNEVIPNGPGKGNLVWGPLVGANVGRLDMQGKNETVNGLSTTTTNLGSVFIENTGFTATIVDPTPGDKTDDNQSYAFTSSTSTLTVGDFNATATFGGTIRDTDSTRSVTLPNPNYEGEGDPEGDLPTIAVVAPWTTPTSGGPAKIALTKIGTGLQALSGANTYTGATTVNGGVLAVTGSLDSTSPVTVNSGGAIAGAGDGFSTGLIGNVTVNSGGRVAPGSTGPGTVGTLTLSSLAVTSGNVHIDFSGTNTDLVNVLGTASFAGASTITPFGTPIAGTYTVIQSTSPITGANTLTIDPFAALPNTRPAAGTLNLSDPNAVKIVVTGGAKLLTWTGLTNANWDLGSSGTTNWTDGAISEKFFNGDSVTFNNTSTNVNPVQLVGDLAPSSVTVAGTRNYTFAGTGSITGATGLTKQGTGTLTVTNPNSYTGTTSIEAGGTVQIGNGGTSGSLGSGEVANEGTLIVNRSDAHAVPNVISGFGNVRFIGSGTTTVGGASTHFGATTIEAGTVKSTDDGSFGDQFGGAVTISAGATLDVGGSNTVNNTNFGAKQFNVVGTGVGGQGAIINSNATVGQQNAFQSIALTGNTTFGAYGRFDVRGGSATLDLAGFTLTKKGTNHFGVVGGTITDGNIVVEEGNLELNGATSVADFATGKKITFQNGTQLQFFNTTGGSITRPMEFNGNVNVNQNSGANSVSDFASPITLKGTATFTFQNTGQTVTDNARISDDGTPRGIIVDNSPQPGTLVLNGDNTYAGNTTVNAGSTLTLQPFTGISNLGDTSTVNLAIGALLNLNFSNTDTIGSLILAGVSAQVGTWGPEFSGAQFTSPMLMGSGFLMVTSAGLLGDYNNDGKVDAADYVVWRKTNINGPQGYTDWKANFGKTLGSGSGTGIGQPGAVPEPGAIVLALLAMAGGLCLRSRGVR